MAGSFRLFPLLLRCQSIGSWETCYIFKDLTKANYRPSHYSAASAPKGFCWPVCVLQQERSFAVRTKWEEKEYFIINIFNREVKDLPIDSCVYFCLTTAQLCISETRISKFTSKFGHSLKVEPSHLLEMQLVLQKCFTSLEISDVSPEHSQNVTIGEKLVAAIDIPGYQIFKITCCK